MDVDVQQFVYGYVIAILAGMIPAGIGWAVRLLRSII